MASLFKHGKIKEIFFLISLIDMQVSCRPRGITQDCVARGSGAQQPRAVEIPARAEALPQPRPTLPLVPSAATHLSSVLLLPRYSTPRRAPRPDDTTAVG